MSEKPNFPTKHPYPEHFWHDALGCHWCHRGTNSMASGHDGMCPVPHIASLETEAAGLRELLIALLSGGDCYGEYGVEIPEELSATFDIGLDSAHRIVNILTPKETTNENPQN